MVLSHGTSKCTVQNPNQAAAWLLCTASSCSVENTGWLVPLSALQKQPKFLAGLRRKADTDAHQGVGSLHDWEAEAQMQGLNSWLCLYTIDIVVTVCLSLEISFPFHVKCQWACLLWTCFISWTQLTLWVYATSCDCNTVSLCVLWNSNFWLLLCLLVLYWETVNNSLHDFILSCSPVTIQLTKAGLKLCQVLLEWRKFVLKGYFPFSS